MVRLNVALLRRGLTVGSQHLLSIRGRRTGELRSTPVSVVTVEGLRYIVAAFPDADWVKNTRAAAGRSSADVAASLSSSSNCRLLSVARSCARFSMRFAVGFGSLNRQTPRLWLPRRIDTRSSASP
jgi:hypothetical protein